MSRAKTAHTSQEVYESRDRAEPGSIPGTLNACAGENLSEKGRGREKSRLKPYQDGGENVECKGELLTDKEGKAVLDKYGAPIYLNRRPPTVTGLALALGFTSRQALLNYQAKDNFVDTVTRAKTRIEQYTEERLFDRDGVQGAKFSLVNNFSGWREKGANPADSQQEQQGNMQALAELLKHPAPDRNLKDFEGDDDR